MRKGEMDKTANRTGRSRAKRRPSFGGAKRHRLTSGDGVVGRFVLRHHLARAIDHAGRVAARLFGDGARLLPPTLRREVLEDRAYLLVAVEVPPMGEEEFARRYAAFVDGVWGEMGDLDPAVVTFCVRTRAGA